jgi:hypothetical protein
MDWYRGINYLKKGYQLRTNTGKGDKGDFVADSQNILARWRKYFFHLLNVRVHGVNDVRRTEIHTAEPRVSEPSALEFELATEKLTRLKTPGIN